MVRLRWLAMALAAALALCACDSAPAPTTEPRPAPQADPRPEERRPNLLVILADDLGWNDVGYHGSELRTPHLDALAREGLRAEHFYVQSVCSPTRAALLTGRYPLRYGLQDGPVWPWAERGLDPEEETLASGLRAAGYATALVGKWHLGMSAPHDLPTRRGFDHFYGHLSGQIDYFTHQNQGGLDWRRGEEPVREAGYSTDLLADEAVRLLRERDPERPLFLLLAFNAPHTPLQAREADLEALALSATGPRRTYAAMVERMDHAIGRVLAAVREAGIADDTLVLFTSDNGGKVRAGARNRPLRGGKGSPYEGGVRVPAIWSWPGRIEAGSQSDLPMHAVDVLPTFLHLAEATTAVAIDGVDLSGALTGEAALPSPDRTLLLDLGQRTAAARSGRFKLVVQGDRTGEPRAALYDLANDPSERNDVSADHPEATAALQAQLAAWDAEAVPSVVAPPRPPPGFTAPPIWGPVGGPVGTTE